MEFVCSKGPNGGPQYSLHIESLEMRGTYIADVSTSRMYIQYSLDGGNCGSDRNILLGRHCIALQLWKEMFFAEVNVMLFFEVMAKVVAFPSLFLF